ncbi:hypothetical protein NL676_018725 [Syzygium grande]|nr:hypothetical protein NL676_018725 [Syzygium grande]
MKAAVDEACGGPVVSCADILAVAARDSVAMLGGPWWQVRLGRRDSTRASKDDAQAYLPSPFIDISNITESFINQRLDINDLVVLSGAHTLGYAQCAIFRSRIYSDTNIDPTFAQPSVVLPAPSEQRIRP